MQFELGIIREICARAVVSLVETREIFLCGITIGKDTLETRKNLSYIIMESPCRIDE